MGSGSSMDGLTTIRGSSEMERTNHTFEMTIESSSSLIGSPAMA